MQTVARTGGGAGLASSQHVKYAKKHHGAVAVANTQPAMHVQQVSATGPSWGVACHCSNTPSTSQRVSPMYRSRQAYVSSSTSSSNRTAISSSNSSSGRRYLPAVSKQLSQLQRQHSPAAVKTAATALAADHAASVVRLEWTAPCGTVFEVMELKQQRQQLQQHHHHHQLPISSSSSKPPVVLIHGLFRAAWYWAESFMPLLAAAGHDSYAISLRGQGTSQLTAAAAAAPSELPQPVTTTTTSSSSSSSSEGNSKEHPFSSGVPLTVNVADIGAFISSRGLSQPPVLIGHSLGGMFVQEYLLRLIWQQQQQQAAAAAAGAQDVSSTAAVQAPATAAAAAAAALPHIDCPLPELSGAVLLASACAGTVMSFGRFIADVGVPEFLYQMYIVLSHAHLNNIATARYCWWQDELSQPEAERHLAAIRNSSSVQPYITSEVGAWYPPAPSAAELALLPPILAVGGAADRIIRPFQVSAAGDYWGADVRILDSVTHDVLLGPQATGVGQEVVSWLQTLPSKSRAAVAGAAAGVVWQGAQGVKSSAGNNSVGRLV